MGYINWVLIDKMNSPRRRYNRMNYILSHYDRPGDHLHEHMWKQIIYKIRHHESFMQSR